MLFCSIQLRPCPAEVVRRQLAHQKLEVTLALYLAGLQQILHQLEDRDDVPALLWVLLIRRQKLRQHQDDRSEQSLRRIIGTREIRHIILNNQVVNSSRALHSLKHTVPKSHKNIAIHMVDHIRRLGVFPANYALDLGEFIDSNGNSYIDIVELNPISCSMCYVNNSIYADVVPEIGECQRQLMMGAEFCYDAIANPKNYDMLRISNKSYTYTSDNQYALL